MGATPAFAVVSWHVKNGGAGFIGVLKAKNRAGTSPSLKDVRTGAVLKCKKAVASGSISQSRTSLNPATLGGLSKSVTKWSSCTAGGFFRFKAHLTTSPDLRALAFSGGVATAMLSGNKISAVISGISGSTCKATISGTSVPLRYLNNVRSFSLNPAGLKTLTVKRVSGACLGQLRSGDSLVFKGIYHVSVPASLTITRF